MLSVVFYVSWLTLFAGCLLVGIGYRGRLLSRPLPRCRSCGFDLTGLVDPSTVPVDEREARKTQPPKRLCPECGGSLWQSDHVRWVFRARQIKWMIGGAMICVLAAGMMVTVKSRAASGKDFFAKLPTTMLVRLMDIGGKDERGAIATVLYERASDPANPMPASDAKVLLEKILALQADQATPWDPQLGDAVESLFRVGSVTREEFLKYITQSTTIDYMPSSDIAAGAWLPVGVRIVLSRAGYKSRHSEWFKITRATIGGREIFSRTWPFEDQYREFRKLSPQERSWTWIYGVNRSVPLFGPQINASAQSGTHSLGADFFVPLDMPTGASELTIEGRWGHQVHARETSTFVPAPLITRSYPIQITPAGTTRSIGIRVDEASLEELTAAAHPRVLEYWQNRDPTSPAQSNEGADPQAPPAPEDRIGFSIRIDMLPAALAHEVILEIGEWKAPPAFITTLPIPAHRMPFQNFTPANASKVSIWLQAPPPSLKGDARVTLRPMKSIAERCIMPAKYLDHELVFDNLLIQLNVSISITTTAPAPQPAAQPPAPPPASASPK
jgi:hypothetical protein